MDISPGQKKAGGELVQDVREINQEAQNNNQGGVVSRSIEAIKHLGKLLKAPFFFSAPPSEVAEIAKQISGKSSRELEVILTDPGNCQVLGIPCPPPKPTNRGSDPVVSAVQTQFGTAEQTYSPLILDLDSLNGVETLSKTAGIHFDHDGNKFAEQTGWVGKNDGLLVWDKNGNGQLDNGAELFGNNTVLKNGSKADNGFTALADLDSNKDGKVDANDAASRQLRVFKDANSNGVVDAGELLTLAQAGVKSLNTGYTTQSVTDANGNQHLQAGSFTTTAGQNRAMDDVWFAVDTARTIDTDLVAVNSTIAALPDIDGFGNVHSLHQAMARDASGKLQGLVQSFQNTSDETARISLFDQILWAWTGAAEHEWNSRGDYIDARKLYSVEAFIGRGFLQYGIYADPAPYAAEQLMRTYALLSESLYGQLMDQTLYKPLHESIGLRCDVVIDSLKLVDVKAADVVLSRDTANLYVTIGTEKITIKDHFAVGYSAAPIEQVLFVDGGKWQKTDLDAACYRGGDGADTIYGTASAETFLGGKGADTLYGGFGGDAYTWARGDGNDMINDIGAATDIDTLKLLDVKAANAVLSRDNANLFVTIGVEKITVKDHFAAGYSAAPIEQILFADGGKWQKADLDAAAYRGGDGADTIYGTASAETFLGGKGADTLYGGFGGDTYIWLKGDGNDTINDIGAATDIDTLKLLDVKAADALLSRDNANLYVTIGAERITIKDHFAVSYAAALIEQIQFADGVNWQKAALDAAPYRGTAGKDTIYGTAQAETFIGGAEADILVGGAGGDVYQLARGDGADTIREYDATAGNIDVLQFMAGISASQLWLRKTGNDLEASVIGTGDKAIVQDWYLGNPYHVEQIKSGDGKLLQDTQVDKLVQAMAGFTPPALGQTSLTAAQQAALAPVLAANWH